MCFKIMQRAASGKIMAHIFALYIAPLAEIQQSLANFILDQLSVDVNLEASESLLLFSHPYYAGTLQEFAALKLTIIGWQKFTIAFKKDITCFGFLPKVHNCALFFPSRSAECGRFFSRQKYVFIVSLLASNLGVGKTVRIERVQVTNTSPMFFLSISTDLLVAVTQQTHKTKEYVYHNQHDHGM